MLRSYGFLSGILTDAVKAKWLAVSPAKSVENLLRKTAKRHVYLSADDVDRLADESGQHRALVLVLVLDYCGLRWGEAIGLRGPMWNFCVGGCQCRALPGWWEA
jgi:integrase